MSLKVSGQYRGFYILKKYISAIIIIFSILMGVLITVDITYWFMY